MVTLEPIHVPSPITTLLWIVVNGSITTVKGSLNVDQAVTLDSTLDVTGDITLPDGVEMVMPGDNITMDVELITPIAMEQHMRFAIREGGRTVGAGRVTEIVA